MGGVLKQAETAEIDEELDAAYEAFLKTAQYLAGLTAQQNPWSEFGRAMVSFFRADFAVFGERGPDGEVFLHDWSFSESVLYDEAVAKQIREETADVIESGFLAARLLDHPKPCSLLSLPMSHESVSSGVICVGHYRTTPLPKKLLNVYLAAAGLGGTMIARLRAEKALTEARDQLECKVRERTKELFAVNEDLRAEMDERREAEEALNRSEAYFRSLIENASDMISILDVGGIFSYIGPSTEHVLGYAPAELTGRNAFELVHEDDLPAVTGAFSRVIQYPDEVVHEELRFLHKSGSWRILEVTARNLLENKAVKGVVVNSRDITPRKMAENDLVTERNQLQTLLEFYQRPDTHVRDIIAFAVEQCVRITESPFGFLGFINEDETLMRTHLWSEQAMEECAVDFRPVEFSLHHAGIWAEAIRRHEPLIVNDYLKPDPRKKGYPEGHVPIKRLMSIPIIRGTKAVATMAVANKELEYTETDLLHLRLFLESAWDMITRKRAEEKVWEHSVTLTETNERLQQQIILREQAEEISVRESAQISAMISGMQEGIVFADADNRVLKVNEYFCGLVQRDKNELLSKAIEDFHTGKTRGEILELIKTFREHCGSQAVMLQRPIANIEAIFRVQPIYVDSQYVGVLLNVVNVSDLVEARRKAEKADQAKSEFLANMSHELRSPLNAILGYSQLMQRDPMLQPGQREYLNIINRSGEHLLALINDVLEISKIEARRIVLNPCTFDLHAMLRDLYAMFRVRANERSLSLEFGESGTIPRYVLADEGKFRQVMINLLGNAVKFTEKGGIAFRVAVRSNSAGMRRLAVEVQDTGVGIAPTELDKVFEYFEQAAAGRKKQTGTGLGLAISREYARMMGGDITVSSRLGEGSTFCFEMEFREGRESDFQEKSQERRVVGLVPGQAVPRILVVEDSEESRTLLVRLLEEVGFDVQEADDGAKGVELCTNWLPHFIWMDIRMPVMGGVEAARRIRAAPGGDSVKIAALTASAMEEERKTILAEGFDDFVRKPHRETEIFDVMAKHLGISYQYDEEEQGEGSVEPESELTSQSLAGLPPGLRDELLEAVVELDSTHILKVVEKITERDSLVGAALRRIAENWDYGRLLSLLEEEGGGAEDDS